jgi:hypothetical protein
MIKTGIEMNILFRNLITSNRLYNLLTAVKRINRIGTLIHMAIKSTRVNGLLIYLSKLMLITKSVENKKN